MHLLQLNSLVEENSLVRQVVQMKLGDVLAQTFGVLVILRAHFARKRARGVAMDVLLVRLEVIAPCECPPALLALEFLARP